MCAANFSYTLDKALELAEQGRLVFPVSENKRPTCPRGFKEATNNPQEVQRLWISYPALLIGVATGEVSGFDALDIDLHNNGDIWHGENAKDIPHTRVHRTRRNGWHYLFKSSPGLRNSAGRIAPGIDVRANGGYIVWWPATGYPLRCDAPLASWPEWLLKLAAPKTSLITQARDIQFTLHKPGYANAALARAVQNVAYAPEGQRNDTLNREAWALMRFVASGTLELKGIASALADAALQAGLDRREIIRTLASAFRSRGVA